MKIDKEKTGAYASNDALFGVCHVTRYENSDIEFRVENWKATCKINNMCQDKLTKKEVTGRIKRISEMPGESDLQHCMESVLYHDFVTCITKGEYKTKKEIENIAKELIKVNELDYERWFK